MKLAEVRLAQSLPVTSGSMGQDVAVPGVVDKSETTASKGVGSTPGSSGGTKKTHGLIHILDSDLAPPFDGLPKLSSAAKTGLQQLRNLVVLMRNAARYLPVAQVSRCFTYLQSCTVNSSEPK